MRRNRLVVALFLVVVTVAAAGAVPSHAAWLAGSSASGGSTKADRVLVASTPTVNVAGASASLSWTATTLASGAPVSGYQISRVNTVSGTTALATGGCAGTVTTLSCTEAAVPTGRWAYRLAGVRGAWVGPLGPQSVTIAVDATAPTVSAVLQKSTLGLTGATRSSGSYRIYANVVDPGDPATGVNTVRADASALTSGQTSVILNPGSFVVGGVTYGYRTGQLTTGSGVTAGTKTYTVTATDVAGNSSGPLPFTAVVDNTAPVATSIEILNGGTTPGKPETGDRVVFGSSERLDPESIQAGWDGSATAVTVRITNNGGGDRIRIRNAANNANLPFGTVFLTNTGYVTAQRDFTGSTMVQVNGVITVTLGTPSGTTGTVITPSIASWNPTTTVDDAAGNPMVNTAVNEGGTSDVQF